MNKLTLSVIFSAVLSCTYMFGQLKQEVPLFGKNIANNPVSHPTEETTVDSLVSPHSLSGSNRVISNISTPAFMLYPASASNNRHIGVVIYPGGGFVNNWLDKEGTDIAM